MEKFSCDWAYTIDGGEVGELEYENFNAATAKVRFFGRNIHRLCKRKMLNALTLACEFQQIFPVDEVPEKTDGKAGFYHLEDFLAILSK